jgi:hypothetical protein
MQQLKWISVPVAAVGLVFLLFGLMWVEAVQLGVAVALLALAASIWRATTGMWPLAHI